eukprot:gene3251-1577_t
MSSSYREVQEPPPPYPGGGATARKNWGQPEISQSRNDPDFEIQQRLDKLKEKEQEEHVSSEGSVNEKFASLTGRHPTSAKSSDILTPRPKLTEEEEVKRLMEGAMAEANLEDSQPKDVAGETDIKGLENRLLKLKGIDPESVKKSQTEDDSSEDEVEATAKVIQKALAEARIDEKVHADGYGKLVAGNENSTENDLQLPAVPCHAVSWKPSSKHTNPEEDEDQELPWCCICNEDASLRCHGCDDDLYCKRCYREGHTNFDMTDHQTSPFKARKKR